MIKIRSGIGYDIHRLGKGKGLFLGGVTVSSSLKAEAHSDGDVLIHSLIDSLLGAMGEPDIGELFPDSDPRLKGVSSSFLLEEVRSLMEKNDFEIINIDCVIIAETPKISNFKKEIRKNLARILGIPISAINIKGKTKEKLDSVGRGEAIEAYAVCMIRSKK
jgi:2-C-methyl-D-erythritol 2,4-cyclodiphosphate synthase